MRTYFSHILTICIGLVFVNSATAITVHTWKDEHGVTHFSDSPSPAGVESEALNFDQLREKSADNSEDYYSIANQWQRLKAERDASNARREAKAERRAAEADRRAALELQQANATQPNGYPVYGPLNGGGIWGGPGIWNRAPNYRHGQGFHHQRPYDAGGYNGRGRHTRVHPNYYSPFHDTTVRPRAFRPKSISNRANSYRPRTGSGFSVNF